jgi:2-desacetyl-2-hydroxyethyl bacteriochlorophyllide A dehydrogenase
VSSVETSIVIRTFNEEKHIQRLLDSILAQNYTNWEIIIVDSGSTDNTLEIARKYPTQIVEIAPKDFSFGRSLNKGCRRARGEYAVLASAHTYPVDNTWLYNMISPFEDSKIGMVFGRHMPMETTKLCEERDFQIFFGTNSKILVDEAFANNANAAIRLALWREIPYDEKLSGLEDIDWAKKIQARGYYVYYKADASLVHIHEEKYTQIYNRFKREAIAFKNIFPETEHSLAKAVVDFFKLAAKDIFYAFGLQKSLRKMGQIIPYRFAQCKGSYDGYNRSPEITEKMKQEFYYPSMNRSVVITGPNHHGLRHSALPYLKEDEVLIKVGCVGVCSTDLDVVEGKLEYYRSGWAKYPIVPGHEFSGTVVKKGSAVEAFEVDDRVVGECVMGCGTCEFCRKDNPFACSERREVGVLNFDGAYSEYMKMPSRFLHRLDPGTELEKACLVEPIAVCVRGIKKLLNSETDSPGDVGVIGGGTIGNLCAQLLALKGYRPTVFDKNEEKLALLRSKVIETELGISNLERFEYVIEASGKLEALEKAIHDSMTGTKILLLGLPYDSMNFNFEEIVAFDKSIIGSVGSTRGDFIEAIQALGKLNLQDFTRHIFPLTEYAEAWEKRRDGKILKAIIRVH